MVHEVRVKILSIFSCACSTVILITAVGNGQLHPVCVVTLARQGDMKHLGPKPELFDETYSCKLSVFTEYVYYGVALGFVLSDH